MYRITPIIDKAYILARVSEEEIFSRYLCEPVFGTSICSPLRQEGSPSCTFYYRRDGKLVFHDHTGVFHGDCFEAVKYIFNVSFVEALNIIAKNFNLTDGPITSPPTKKLEDKQKLKSDIKVKRRLWNEEDKHYWKAYGITRELLERFNIAPVELAWLDNQVNYRYTPGDPCYVYYFLDDDYKLYFPMRDKFRFIGNTQKIQGYQQLPANGEILVITKSMKDVLLYASYGIPAIAPQAEGVVLSDEFIRELKSRFKFIASNYDFDRAGIRGAGKLRDIHGIIPLFLTNGKYKSKNYGAKDLTDYRKKFGDAQTKELIDNVYNDIIE